MVRFKFKNSLGCAPWPCLSQHNVAQLLVVFHFLEQCLHLRKHWNGHNLLQNIFDVGMTDISLSENHIKNLVKCNLTNMLCFNHLLSNSMQTYFSLNLKCSFQLRLE